MEIHLSTRIGDASSILVTGLDRVNLKMLMKHIGETHHYGFVLLMIKSSRGQLGALNAESFSERTNHASRIVIDEDNTRMGHGTLNKLLTMRMNRTFMKSCRH